MSQFDDLGMIVDRFSDIEEKLQTSFKLSFGDNIKLDAESVFGQLIKNFALVVAEINELAEYVASCFDPQGASGVALSKLVMLNGINRNSGTFSTAIVSCTCSGSTTIPQGTLLEDATKNQWTTDADLIFLAAGSQDISCTCTIIGEVAAGAGTITEIVTPVFNFDSCTNPSPANIGRSEETDSELRERRVIAAERSASTSISNIYRVLTEISEVAFVKVIANETSTTDVHGIPPHNILSVISGGADQSIAAALHNYVGAGIGTYGTTSVSYDDPITGDTFTLKFSRPIDKNIYITVNLTKSKFYPANGDQLIEQAILDYFDLNQKIGEDVIFSRLYTPINSVIGHQVDSLFIGTSPTPSATNNIPVSLTEIAKTDITFMVIS